MVSGSGVCARRVVIDARHHMLDRLGVGRGEGAAQRAARVRRRPVRRSLPLRRPRSAGDEVPPLPPQSDEHQALPRPHPLPRPPAKILRRTVRGMVPHKTKRGAAALASYDKTRRMVVPGALKVLRLQAGHKYCLLGRLLSEVGWNHYDTIKELENKRNERAQVTYERRETVGEAQVEG